MRRLSSLSVSMFLVLTAATAVAQEAPAEVPREHRSARAAVRSFLESFYTGGEPDLETAASALDLSEIPPEVRLLKGRELAAKLKNVLDRTRYVELQEIPDEASAPPVVLVRQAEGEIVVGPTPDGEWLFTASTVRGLDHFHRAVEEREVVEGVEREAPVDATLSGRLRRLVPVSLQRELFFLEAWQWLGVFAIILLGVVVGRVFVYAATHAVQRVLARRGPLADPEMLIRTLGPLGALVMLVVWGLGIVWLGLPVSVFALYYKAVRVVAIVVAAVVAYRLADVLSDLMARRAERTDTRFDDLLVPLVRKSLKVFVAAVGLVLVAETVGQDITALVAGLGLGGLAVALAAQDTVSNLFGSLTVLLDRPFQVGDWVIVGDVEGTVEEVGFRSTRIRTFYNSLITLPNSTLIKASVDNLGERRYRRWKTTLSLTYDTPPEKIDAFCEGLRELVRKHPHTRKDYFHVYLNDFGAASLNVLLYVFFVTPDWATELRERHRLGVDILRLASEVGVEFAFPTQTVYLRREEWQAPGGAGEGYAEASERLRRQATDGARRLVDRSMGGEIPPPVVFDVPARENRGELDE